MRRTNDSKTEMDLQGDALASTVVLLINWP